jgi:hypothetical protein
LLDFQPCTPVEDDRPCAEVGADAPGGELTELDPPANPAAESQLLTLEIAPK